MIKKETVDIFHIEYQEVVCPQCGLPMDRPRPFDAPQTYGCPNCQVFENAPYEGGIPYPRLQIIMTNGTNIYLPAEKW